MRGDRALARASNLLGYKEYDTNRNEITNNSIKYTPYWLSIPVENYERVGPDNIYMCVDQLVVS